MTTVLICDADEGVRAWSAEQVVQLGGSPLLLGSPRALAEVLLSHDVPVAVVDLDVDTADRALINRFPETHPQLSLVLTAREIAALDGNASASLAASEVLIKPLDGVSYRRALRRAIADSARLQELVRLREEATQLKALVHDQNSALHQLSARYERLVECVPGGVLRFDRQGGIRFANTRAAELFRQASSTLRTLSLYDLVAPADHAGLARALDEVARGRFSAFAGLRLQLLSGRSVELTVMPLSGSGQELQGLLADGPQDDSQQAQLAELNRLERFAVLTSGVIHDVNNHLAMVAMALDSIGTELDQSSELSRSLATLSAQTMQSGELFRNMLRVARSDRAPMAPLELGGVIRDLLGFLRMALRQHWTVTTSIEHTPLIIGCADLLQQAVLNLVINAKKAQPDGGAIHIGLTHDPEVADFGRTMGAVCLSVSDSGQGLSAKEISHIFSPGFSSRPLGDGTGLGLALVHHIVVEHSGVISVNSDEGMGTRFQLLFPPYHGDVEA